MARKDEIESFEHTLRRRLGMRSVQYSRIEEEMRLKQIYNLPYLSGLADRLVDRGVPRKNADFFVALMRERMETRKSYANIRNSMVKKGIKFERGAGTMGRSDRKNGYLDVIKGNYAGTVEGLRRSGIAEEEAAIAAEAIFAKNFSAKSLQKSLSKRRRFLLDGVFDKEEFKTRLAGARRRKRI